MGMKRRSARKNTRRGSRRQAGGGLGQSYGFTGAPVIPGGGVDTGVAWTPQSSCMAAERPGMAPMPTSGLGLPGLGGGGRRKRKSQRGGRYGFTGEPAPTSGTPFLGGYAPISHVPCEGARANPMNPTQLGGAAAFDVITPPPNSMQAQLDQKGGAQAPLGYGFVGDAVDNRAYYAPTAGYSNAPSTWVGSTGSPSMLQQPYEARAMNPACVKTGGGSRKRSSRRKSRKSRKSRR